MLNVIIFMWKRIILLFPELLMPTVWVMQEEAVEHMEVCGPKAATPMEEELPHAGIKTIAVRWD